LALFFQAIVLSHYNSYNLSSTAHVASEQIFSTLATLAETAVFLYMGMGVFTGRFSNYDPFFTFLALLFCCQGRALNIFPLSWLANLCRSGGNGGRSLDISGGSSQSGRSRGSFSGSRKITVQMQCVLWFAGLRGRHCLCLGHEHAGTESRSLRDRHLVDLHLEFTERMLTHFGIRQSQDDDDDDGLRLNRLTFTPQHLNSPQRRPSLASQTSQRVYKGAKKIWKNFAEDFLKPYFGGSTHVQSPGGLTRDHLGNYELSNIADYNSDDDDTDADDDAEFGSFTNGTNGANGGLDRP
jgi:hypothetical protein